MAQQETHIGTPPIFRFAETMRGSIFGVLDRIAGRSARDQDEDNTRRCRLLVANTLVIFLFAQFFFYKVYAFEGFVSPTAWVFVCGSGLMLLNLPLLRWIRSPLLPGKLFVCELIVSFGLMAYYNGGYDAASLIWNLTIPLLAVVLVGSRFGLLCSRDITERQRAEEALRDSEQRYRSVVESAPDLIFMLNTEGVITALNPAFETLTGWSQEQFLGQPFAPLLHPDDLPQVMKHLQHVLKGEPPEPFELRILHQQSKTIIGEATVTPQTRNGQVVGILGIARDITHRKEVERLKDELISTVSHELRTPLASLRGFTELMLEQEFPPAQQRKFLTIIQKESIRLTNLINDFLDLERIASGRQSYSFDTVALEPLLQETIAMADAESARHPCHLELSAPLPQVQGDADRLRQVLLNLLTNAIKYSPHGGTVRVGARRDGQKVVLWVADQGIGIPPDARANLFQKFYRVDNAETRRIGGTGLGLALVKEIVDAHGGEVWVESEVDLGSTFFFSLPIPEDKPSQTVPQATTDRGQSAPDMGSGKNNAALCQQESTKYEEGLRQSIDRIVRSQCLSSGT
jgi:PAS domain S-box-containing protein